MDLGEIGWGGVDRIGLQFEGPYEGGNEPSGSIKYWDTFGWQYYFWPLE
jgi:hypothetical protein